MKIPYKLKYFLNRFEFLKVYTSPFKPLQLKWYFGKIAVGGFRITYPEHGEKLRLKKLQKKYGKK